MGRLAAVDINTPSTITNVYTPAAGKTGVVTLSICNLTAQAVKLRIAFQSNDDVNVGSGEWIEYDFELSPGNTYERSGLVVSGTQTISVYSTGRVAAVVWGFEE